MSLTLVLQIIYKLLHNTFSHLNESTVLSLKLRSEVYLTYQRRFQHKSFGVFMTRLYYHPFKNWKIIWQVRCVIKLFFYSIFLNKLMTANEKIKQKMIWKLWDSFSQIEAWKWNLYLIYFSFGFRNLENEFWINQRNRVL